MSFEGADVTGNTTNGTDGGAGGEGPQGPGGASGGDGGSTSGAAGSGVGGETGGTGGQPAGVGGAAGSGGGGGGEAGSGGSGAGGSSGSSSGKPCQAPADCDDGNVCTTEQCVEGICQVANQPKGTLCDDGDGCSDSDRCDGGGKCGGTSKSVDDGNPCTTDSCDTATGAVSHAAQAGKTCDDGNLCTDGDVCGESGACSGSPLAIDDGNECTTDLCDPTTGNIDHKGQSGCGACSNDADCNDNNPCTTESCNAGKCAYQDAPPGTACDDGNACTLGDQCDPGGKCGGTSKSVDDGNPCTTDSCDTATGDAKHAPAPGQSCTDSNACTLGDLCNEQGQCVGVNKSVDDANECTKDSCDPATGNVSHATLSGCKPCDSNGDCDDSNPCTTDACGEGKCVYENAPAGGSCTDGNPCTTGDKCDGGGKCSGTPKSVDDGNPCTTDSCDPATGEPKYAPASGASCNDNNGCTLGDQCDQGVCKGTPKNTDDANECTTDACDPATGNVSHTQLPSCKPCANNGDCNDNNPCTTESCNAGKCAYANAPSTTNCNDNNPCTTGDKCNGSGQCGGTAKACNAPPNSCHQSVGVCNQANGECAYAFLSNGTACSDSNACTLGDTCQAGACVAGAGKTCSTPPNSQCYNTAGSCDTGTGACSYPVKVNGTACTDSNACTLNDTCQNGTCTPSAVKACNGPFGECYKLPGTCNPANGSCSYTLDNGGPCDDGIFCTKNDACSNGMCSGNWQPGCNEP